MAHVQIYLGRKCLKIILTVIGLELIISNVRRVRPTMNRC